jgi:hypothetical protein
MPTPSPPFRRKPLRQHVALALLLALACVVAGAGLVSQSRAALSDARTRLATLQAQATQARPAPSTLTAASWADKLPSAAQPDRLVRQMIRAAPGLQIHSLSVEHARAGNQAPAPARIGVALNSDYRGFKAWLGELLARQPGLAMQSLTLQRSADARVDVQLTLVLYMRSTP